MPSPSGSSTTASPFEGRQPGADAGNVMGMPATAAQWRSKGGFIGKPRARVIFLLLLLAFSPTVLLCFARALQSLHDTIMDIRHLWAKAERSNGAQNLCHQAVHTLPDIIHQAGFVDRKLGLALFSSCKYTIVKHCQALSAYSKLRATTDLRLLKLCKPAPISCQVNTVETQFHGIIKEELACKGNFSKPNHYQIFLVKLDL